MVITDQEWETVPVGDRGDATAVGIESASSALVKPGIGIDPGIGQGHTAQAAQNAKLEVSLLEARLEDESETDEALIVEPDPCEPPELEDLGDSAALDDDSSGSAFDRAWTGDLPLVSQLPQRLRPPVRYRIDSELVVHALYRKKTEDEDLEQAVAEALAEHIRRTRVVLESPGDWCRIPYLGRDPELAALVPEAYAKQLGPERLHSLGSVAKEFAIELPNRDVIVPQVLLWPPARKGGRTTRAAALRSEPQRPSTTPDGESWSEKDWKEFSSNQRKGGVRSSKSKNR